MAYNCHKVNKSGRVAAYVNSHSCPADIGSGEWPGNGLALCQASQVAAVRTDANHDIIGLPRGPIHELIAHASDHAAADAEAMSHLCRYRAHDSPEPRRVVARGRRSGTTRTALVSTTFQAPNLRLKRGRRPAITMLTFVS